MNITITVNGSKHNCNVDPLRRLLDILREDLRLTGTKEGCGEGECGACSIIFNGKLSNSCLIPAAQCDGAEIITIEGFKDTRRGKVIIEAFAKAHSVQCGFCTPGMVLAAETILRNNPQPTEDDIRFGISGNICRCTGYDMIIDGILLAAETGKKEGLWQQ